MGAWGPGLYSDDMACDVRDGWRDCVGDGMSGREATDCMIAAWGDALNDIDAATPFWFALADTQWRCGRLEERVREVALQVIAEGVDLARWDADPAARRKRKSVLETLRGRLVSPQPKPKRIAKRHREQCDWQPGEMIGYRLRSGRWVLFRVAWIQSDAGGTHPICELLDWVGEAFPSPEEMRALPLKNLLRPSKDMIIDGGEEEAGEPGGIRYRHVVRHTIPLLIGQLKAGELPVDRVARLGVTLEPVQRVCSCRVAGWDGLDEALEHQFGLV